MTSVTWDEVSQAPTSKDEKSYRCKKCHKVTTGTFNEVTQKCFACHMEETS